MNFLKTKIALFCPKINTIILNLNWLKYPSCNLLVIKLSTLSKIRKIKIWKKTNEFVRA